MSIEEQCEFYRQETHRWKAACQKLEKENSELRKALSLCSAFGDDDLAFRNFGLSDKGFRLAEVRKLAVSAIHRESTK